MNIRQERFAEHYHASGNATDAAVKAGYSKRTAYSIGNRLLKNVEVQKYLQSLEQSEKEKRILTAQDRKVILSDIARDEMNDPTARIKSIDTLNKMTGEYIVKADADAGQTEKTTSRLYDVLEDEETGSDYDTITEAETGDEVGAHAEVQRQESDHL